MLYFRINIKIGNSNTTQFIISIQITVISREVSLIPQQNKQLFFNHTSSFKDVDSTKIWKQKVAQKTIEPSFKKNIFIISQGNAFFVVVVRFPISRVISLLNSF